MDITLDDLPWNAGETFSVEELAVWSCSSLAEVYPDRFNEETVGEQTPTASVSPFPIIKDSNERAEMMVIRVVIPMKTVWRTAGKIWQTVTSLGTQVLPEAYKSN